MPHPSLLVSPGRATLVALLQNLSEIVLEAELATGAQMREAARLADRSQRPLIAALVETAEIDQTALVVALARHTRTEVADPGKLQVDPEALRQVPQQVCGRLKVMPLSVSLPGDDRTLRLAMADPTDAVARAEIEHVSGCRIEPVLVTLDAVEELIHRHYKELITEVMPRRRDFVPSETEENETPDPAAQSGRKRPITAPHHVASGDPGTSPDTLIRAVIKLLQDKGVIERGELDAAIAAALEERDPSP